MLQFMNVFGTIFQIALFQVLLVGGSFYWKFFFQDRDNSRLAAFTALADLLNLRKTGFFSWEVWFILGS